MKEQSRLRRSGSRSARFQYVLLRPLEKLRPFPGGGPFVPHGHTDLTVSRFSAKVPASFLFLCFCVTNASFPTAPGTLILVACQSCPCSVSSPVLAFSSFPAYSLACAQASSSACLRDPFPCLEPPGRLLPAQCPPPAPAPPAPASTTAHRMEKLPYLCVGRKGAKDLPILPYVPAGISRSAGVHQRPRPIRSRAHVVPGARESVRLHMLGNRCHTWGHLRRQMGSGEGCEQ